MISLSNRKCVMEWEEPHDSTLYCIKSDKNHMIASGSSYYGVVRLWDKRKTRCLQVTVSMFHLFHLVFYYSNIHLCSDWLTDVPVGTHHQQPSVQPVLQHHSPVRCPGLCPLLPWLQNCSVPVLEITIRWCCLRLKGSFFISSKPLVIFLHP